MSAIKSGHSSSVSTTVKKDKKNIVDGSLQTWSTRDKKYIATRIWMEEELGQASLTEMTFLRNIPVF